MKALQPEIVPEIHEEKQEDEKTFETKNKRDRHEKKKHPKVEVEESEEDIEPSEPELTAMELAWQAAKEKANHKRENAIKAKKQRSVSDEQEDILSRTIGKR